jgi:dihydrofolate reductase
VSNAGHGTAQALATPMIAHIVAATQNNVIGKDNTLPWSIPEDMQWFRQRTKGRALIMGRKTFESLPQPLPNRLNVIVTRQTEKAAQLEALTKPGTPVVVRATLEEALEHCRRVASDYGNEIFIIGGGQIYAQSMGLIDTIFLTRIAAVIEGDAHYPAVPGGFKRVSERVVPPTESLPGYSFQEFRRSP